jgi:protein involved in temperature-dependent protein secretion
MIDRTILTPSVREVEAQFKDQPAVDTTLRYSLTGLYETLGFYDKALPLAESAVNAGSLG